MNRSILRSGWSFVWLLLIVATWLSSCGQFWLEGVTLAELESIARGAGLTGTSGPGNLESFHSSLFISSDFGFWPFDPLTVSSWVRSLCTLLGCVLVMVASYKTWRNPISAALVSGSLYWGASTTWVVTTTPTESLLHLALALGFCGLLWESIALLAIAVLLALPLSGATFITLALPLMLFSLRPKKSDQKLYKKFVSVLALLGMAYCLYRGIGWPSLASLNPWILVPLVGLWRLPKLREQRKELYLVLILASLISATPCLAIALSLGDLSAHLFDAWQDKPDAPAVGDHEFQVSSKVVFHGLALVAFIAVILPGEQHLNRKILVPSQKKHISLDKLFLPFSLHKHLRNFEKEDWRQRAPFPELEAHDVELFAKMSPKFMKSLAVVTTDELGENRRLSLLYSIINSLPLKGWSNAEELNPPLLACKSSGKNLLKKGPTLVLRDHNQAQIADESERPSTVSPNLSKLVPVPYQEQILSETVGSGFGWTSPGGEPWNIGFPEEPTVLKLGLAPLMHTIGDLQDSAHSEKVEIHPFRWEISGDFSEHIHPSGTLLPVKLTLKNTSLARISSESIEYIEFKTRGPLSYSPFQQRLREKFLLDPGQSTDIELTLATPTWSSTFELSLVMVTKDGQRRELAITGANTIRTYYRLPPVAHWVEPSSLGGE